jgi:UPF0755 protein
MTFALALTALYVIAVGAVLAVQLRRSPQAVAGDVRGSGQAVAVAPSGGHVCFDIEAGSGGDEIASRLVRAGVVGSERQFNLLLEYAGGGADLRAGRYDFPLGSPAAEVIRRLREGDTHETFVSVPEGMRLEQLGEWLDESDIVSLDDWLEAISGARPESVLEGRPEGASLIGYLLPATYPLGCGEPPTAESLVEAMLAALDAQFTPELRAEAEASGMTLHEVLTLASIVEKEAVMPDEQPLIASALLNRLEVGIALQTDPTVQFAVATANEGERGWWPEIFLEDLEYDSLYNTYQYPGLPPGPIANPGIGAITAVIRPAETDFFYFVARCDGSERHEFAATLDEHNANVALCHSG